MKDTYYRMTATIGTNEHDVGSVISRTQAVLMCHVLTKRGDVDAINFINADGQLRASIMPATGEFEIYPDIT